MQEDAQPQELKKKVAHGFYWSTAQQLAQRVISFGSQLILARLLLPQDFGTVALLTICIAVASQIIDSGFGTSLLRDPEANDDDYSTVLYFNVGVATLMYLLLFCIAPWVADFYHKPVVADLLRAMSLVLIINSFGAVQNTLLTKDINFKRQFFIFFPSSFLGISTTIILAWLDWGPWALVWGQVTAATANMLLLWIFSAWRPSLVFNKSKLKKHFNFGYKMLLSGLSASLYDNLLQMIIGRKFSAASLAFINQAVTLYTIPAASAGDSISRVTYPAFVKVQDDPELLKSGYLRGLRTGMLLIAPILIMMALLAEPMIRYLYGERWLLSAEYFQILFLIGLIYMPNNYSKSILTIKGKSNLYLALEIFREVFGTITMFLAVMLGIKGLLWGYVLISMVYLLVNVNLSSRFLNISPWRQLKEIGTFILYACVAGSGLWALDHFVTGQWPDFWRLAAGGSTMGILYFVISWTLARQDYLYVFSILRGK